jgi:pimeloyl-ACP methyl ester carboxylesterase
MATLPKPPKPQVLRADDGVNLSYYTIGSGAGIIIIPGAMSSALSQYELALSLSSSYTVYLFSRRSRGLSGTYPSSVTETQTPLLRAPGTDDSPIDLPYDPQFCLDVLKTDLNDLFALMRHTSATSLFGISSGALLVLAACTHRPADVANSPIKKAIIFDPPLILSSPLAPQGILPDLPSIRRYEAEIAAGDTTSALVTAMRIVQLGPGWLRKCPDFIIRFLTGLVMSAEAREQGKRKAAGEEDEGAVTMEMLAPVLRYDFALVQAMVGDARGFARVAEGRRVLLVGGGGSPGYMRFAMRGVVDAVREGMEWEEVGGVGHELFENKRRNGRVELGVGTVRKFLAGDDMRE